MSNFQKKKKKINNDNTIKLDQLEVREISKK